MVPKWILLTYSFSSFLSLPYRRRWRTLLIRRFGTPYSRSSSQLRSPSGDDSSVSRDNRPLLLLFDHHHHLEGATVSSLFAWELRLKRNFNIPITLMDNELCPQMKLRSERRRRRRGREEDKRFKMYRVALGELLPSNESFPSVNSFVCSYWTNTSIEAGAGKDYAVFYHFIYVHHEK